MGAGHSHSHDDIGHGHSHAPADFGRAFAIGVLLNSAFVLIEAGFGLWSGSMALLADAGHNLSDVLSLLIAWGASWAAARANQRGARGRPAHDDCAGTDTPGAYCARYSPARSGDHDADHRPQLRHDFL